MGPQRFKIGQPITRNNNGLWKCYKKVPFWTILMSKWFHVSGPLFGKIYHVLHYGTSAVHTDVWFVQLKELSGDDWYSERSFDPVEINTEQISELIEETLSQKL